MSLEFITSPERWNAIFDELPGFAGQVYYSHAYHAACASNGDGQPGAVLHTSRAGRIFYPFLLRKIPLCLGGEGYYDLETAYGYGGPQFFTDDQVAIAEFKALFAEWARQQRVVAEFIRFNPLTAMHEKYSDVCQVSHNRTTVSINLSKGFAGLLAGCIPARQRNWRRAGRENLKMRRLDDPHEFAALYQQTMQRLAARSYYLFSADYFAALSAMPAASRYFAGAFTPDNQLAAAAVFLLDRQSAHYHLGASDPQYKDTQASAFLMLEFARLAAETGRATLHLGGGLSLAEDDRLFRFKAGFAPGRHPFFIGRRVHQPEVYATLSQNWQRRTGLVPQILLHYHYGANDENL